MRKLRCVIGMMGLLLGACSTQQETQPSAPAQQAYTGPVVEISGVEPRYEPYNPGNMQDYTVNGKRYSIVQNPQNFSEKRRKPSPNAGGDIRRKARRALKISQALPDFEHRL